MPTKVSSSAGQQKSARSKAKPGSPSQRAKPSPVKLAASKSSDALTKVEEAEDPARDLASEEPVADVAAKAVAEAAALDVAVVAEAIPEEEPAAAKAVKGKPVVNGSTKKSARKPTGSVTAKGSKPTVGGKGSPAKAAPSKNVAKVAASDASTDVLTQGAHHSSGEVMAIALAEASRFSVSYLVSQLGRMLQRREIRLTDLLKHSPGESFIERTAFVEAAAELGVQLDEAETSEVFDLARPMSLESTPVRRSLGEIEKSLRRLQVDATLVAVEAGSETADIVILAGEALQKAASVAVEEVPIASCTRFSAHHSTPAHCSTVPLVTPAHCSAVLLTLQ